MLSKKLIKTMETKVIKELVRKGKNWSARREELIIGIGTLNLK